MERVAQGGFNVPKMVVPLYALATVSAVEDRINGDLGVFLKISYCLTDFGDSATELVSHRDRGRLIRHWMWLFVWNENRTRRVLMKIGTTDTTRIDRNSDLSRSNGRYFDLFDSNLLLAMICCSTWWVISYQNGIIVL